MENENSVYITIFTPTFNRAHTIERLYISLKNQTCYNFEWLIVDDGSTDNTNRIVEKWFDDAPFPIYYYNKENGGKHRAINFALKRANGELFFIVDSDDFLVETAVETIIRICNTLSENTERKYAGIAGCKGFENGNLVGTSFKGEFIDCLSVERAKYGISGDKAEVFFTKILKKYPFPEFEGENFVTEAAVWDKMALDGYFLRYFNEIIYLCEYLDDGLSYQGLELYYKNPQGYGYYLTQSRMANKFDRNVQIYFDVECYLHWKSQRNIKEIADLIGINPYILVVQVVFYKLRRYGSKYKQLMLKLVKRGNRR